MNDKIKELAEQCGVIDILANHAQKYAMYQEPLEKFAELIVRECMLQCSKVENDDELSNYDGGFKDGAMLCYQQIQEHFGIKDA